MAHFSITRKVVERAPYPAIVVAGWQRKASLARLLKALSGAIYPDSPVTLHISIDYSPLREAAGFAEAFDWPHGPKVVELHPGNLGLRGHLLHCGSLAKRYGSIVLLEDDLYVARGFYGYAVEALAFFAGDARIAGVSLYHYTANEEGSLPFEPLTGAADNYFLQWTPSWGQAWTGEQWESFEKWLGGEVDPDKWLPEHVRAWEPDSWKRLHIAYLRARGLYFAYPRLGLSTHFGEAGRHSVLRGAQQSPLLAGERRWRFEGLDECLGVYDAWFELEPESLKRLQPDLADYDFDVDLYGRKEADALGGDFVLSSRSLPRGLTADPLAVPLGYAMDLLPPVLNVVEGLAGSEICLWRRSDLPVGPKPIAEYLAQVSGWHLGHVEREQGLRPLRFSVVVLWSGPAEAVERSLVALRGLDCEVILMGKGDAGGLSPGLLGKEALCLQWADGLDAWEALASGLDAASGDALLCLEAGQVLPAGVLGQVRGALEAYGRVDWLLLLPGGMSLPAQRWSRDRYGRASAVEIGRSLGPGAWCMRRRHWLKLRHGGELDAYGNFLSAAFEESLPIAAEIAGPACVEGGIFHEKLALDKGRAGLRARRTVWGRLLSALARPFFLRDGRLRWVHQQIEQFPPVLRPDADKASGWDMRQF